MIGQQDNENEDPFTTPNEGKNSLLNSNTVDEAMDNPRSNGPIDAIHQASVEELLKRKNAKELSVKIRSMMVKISENGYRGVRYSLIAVKSLSSGTFKLLRKMLKPKNIILITLACGSFLILCGAHYQSDVYHIGPQETNIDADAPLVVNRQLLAMAVSDTFRAEMNGISYLFTATERGFNYLGNGLEGTLEWKKDGTSAPYSAVGHSKVGVPNVSCINWLRNGNIEEAVIIKFVKGETGKADAEKIWTFAKQGIDKARKNPARRLKETSSVEYGNGNGNMFRMEQFLVALLVIVMTMMAIQILFR